MKKIFSAIACTFIFFFVITMTACSCGQKKVVSLTVKEGTLDYTYEQFEEYSFDDGKKYVRVKANSYYDGSEFKGYQKQNDKRTVQGELEKALKEISGGKKIDVHASGRTDAGVHAKCQCAHFDLQRDVKLYNLKNYLK